MRHLAMIALVVAASPIAAVAAHDLGEAKQLKVLYAGPSGTEREKAFVTFLREHFTTVAVIDIEMLSVDTAKQHDVVIADGKRLYPMDEKRQLATPRVKIGADFTKPIIMISAVGGTIQKHTKIEWL